VDSVGRSLIVLGLLIAGIGVALRIGVLMPPVGRLPGDIVIRRGSLTVFVPVTSMVLVSLLLTLIVRLLARR
jgi:hypothetical protein